MEIVFFTAKMKDLLQMQPELEEIMSSLNCDTCPYNQRPVASQPGRLGYHSIAADEDQRSGLY